MPRLDSGRLGLLIHAYAWTSTHMRGLCCCNFPRVVLGSNQLSTIHIYVPNRSPGRSRRDKPTIEFDPEIEKTLKKNRSRVKAQRDLQFDQEEETNSEEGASEKSIEEELNTEEELVEENTEEEIQNNMADNANNQWRTLADYTNPTTTSCGSSIVWPNVDANNFELKPALVQLVQQN
ncbi:hypothetical protein PIB30_074681 [Stylosanthes scabra]|uniref:Uncharacterized protein n=1 Tax=Stylosanthes scabra TaxID=79078 RepID=A0ABU6ZNE4_9FABA|nr:hypothetical protein [Stylosanthes scabra]